MQIVPQYIDVEDKIAGPLTWKHLGWLFAGGGMLLIAFTLLDKLTFFIVAIPIMLLTGAFAFYRPNGMTFVEFVGNGFVFLFHPKTYTWQREMVEEKKKKKKQSENITVTRKKKEVEVEDVVAMAQVLDSGGEQRNKRIQELIKENAKNANKK